MTHTMEDMPPTIDTRALVRLRYEAGLSQEALAHHAGLTQPTIRRIESGRTRPTPKTLRAIADALHVTVAALLVDDSGERPESDANLAGPSTVEEK